MIYDLQSSIFGSVAHPDPTLSPHCSSYSFCWLAAPAAAMPHTLPPFMYKPPPSAFDPSLHFTHVYIYVCTYVRVYKRCHYLLSLSFQLPSSSKTSTHTLTIVAPTNPSIHPDTTPPPVGRHKHRPSSMYFINAPSTAQQTTRRRGDSSRDNIGRRPSPNAPRQAKDSSRTGAWVI